jgi:hypothetical protein
MPTLKFSPQEMEQLFKAREYAERCYNVLGGIWDSHGASQKALELYGRLNKLIKRAQKDTSKLPPTVLDI